MSSPKIITVYGATGSQGGSVVASLLQNKTGAFLVRGITRNTVSDKSQALAKQGVEMLQADGLNKQQMIAALNGSWGLFVNTNSDDPAIGEEGLPSEIDVGKIIIDAAAAAGVQHVVYSGMESAAEITQGAIPNAAFDEKHAIGEYAKSKGFQTVNIVSPGWYLENHLIEELSPIFGGFPFSVDEEGFYTLRTPTWGGSEEIPFIGIGDDYGDIVHGAFLNPEKYSGQLVQAVSQSATLDQLAQGFTKVTGKKARFVPVEDWRSMETYGMRALETVKYMFGFCQHSGGRYYGNPNNVAPAAELKAAAAKAQGKGASESGLATIERFFAKYLS